MRRDVWYTIRFTAVVCIVGSVVVSSSSVLLRDRQERNRLLSIRRNVLEVAGIGGGTRIGEQEVDSLFAGRVRAVVVDLETGARLENVDARLFDQRLATQDPATSRAVAVNDAGIARVPRAALIYEVMEASRVTAIILPVEGRGLWSTMYGFLALTSELDAVSGITFYAHAETPGLGAEIDNPRWKARWIGRRPFDADWEPRLEVVKGMAGDPAVAPYEVDGLSGATLTGRGVTDLIRFWLGRDGFGPFLTRYREERGIP